MKTTEEIEAMLVAITPGKWEVRDSPLGDGGCFVQAPKLDAKHPYDIEILGDDEALYPTRRADAEFIAAAPEIVRALLAENATLREAVEMFKDDARAGRVSR